MKNECYEKYNLYKNKCLMLGIDCPIDIINGHITLIKEVDKIPEYVEVIGNEAFSEGSITEVILPPSIIKIGFEAFAHCNITNVTFNENITEIGDLAFRDCTIKEIEIPPTVKKLGDLVFLECYDLEKLKLSKKFKSKVSDLGLNEYVEVEFY